MIADYKLIQKYHVEKGWPITVMCHILEISRAAYYKWLNRKPSKTEQENEKLLEEIQTIASKNNRLFGYRKMAMMINKQHDTPINKKRILRLMCIYGLLSIYRQKKNGWRKSDPQKTTENILDRDFNASAPNEKWGTDITEIKYPGIPQKAYLSTILDLYDRYPVAVAVSQRNDAKLVDDTFKSAAENNPDASPLLHSDRGFQYTRAVFQKRLQERGMTQSMSRVNCCIDNGPVEGFQGIIKDMLFILYPNLKTYEELVRAIHNTFKYYIEEYPQERFNGKTAGEVRAEGLQAENPVQYPIKKNLRIERFWAEIERKKAIQA